MNRVTTGHRKFTRLQTLCYLAIGRDVKAATQKVGMWIHPYVPWSKVAILGIVIPPLIGILIIGI